MRKIPQPSKNQLQKRLAQAETRLQEVAETSAQMLRMQHQRHEREKRDILDRTKKIVHASKTYHHESDADIVSFSIMVSRREACRMRDAEILWEEVLGKLGFCAGSALFDRSMKVMRQAFEGHDHGQLQRAKHEFVSNVMRGSKRYARYEDLLYAWDAVFEYLRNHKPAKPQS